MAIRGLDLSHHNKVTDWTLNGYEFVFIKCTEGNGFLDGTYTERKVKIRETKKLLGAYHFARGGDAKSEADWFLKNVGGLLPGEIVILDYEIYTLKDPASWCLEWAKRVEEKLGFKPIIYTYHALLLKYDWKKCSDYNLGLWAARYSVNDGQYHPEQPPATGSWPFYAIHQYTSRGSVHGIVGYVDLNHTEMSKKALKKYGKPGETEECKKCLIHCPK